MSSFHERKEHRAWRVMKLIMFVYCYSRNATITRQLDFTGQGHTRLKISVPLDNKSLLQCTAQQITWRFSNRLMLLVYEKIDRPRYDLFHNLVQHHRFTASAIKTTFYKFLSCSLPLAIRIYEWRTQNSSSVDVLSFIVPDFS